MRQLLVLVCLTLVASIVSHAAQAEQPMTSVADEVALEPGDQIHLAISGAGWGRLDIVALGNVDLAFHLKHDQIDDLCDGTGDGEGIYDQGKLTSVHLFTEDGAPLNRFTWIGSPYWPSFPVQSGSCGTSDRVALEAGERVTFVFADTAGGYTTHLTTNQTVTRTLPGQTIALGPHPGFLDIDLRDHAFQTSGTATAVAELEYREEAHLAFDLAEGAAMFSRWTHQGSAPIPAHVGAGTFHRDFKLTGPDNETVVMNHQTAQVYWFAGYSSDHVGLASTWLQTPGSHRAHYWAYHDGVGLASTLDHGARFVMIPSDRPATT